MAKKSGKIFLTNVLCDSFKIIFFVFFLPLSKIILFDIFQDDDMQILVDQ